MIITRVMNDIYKHKKVFISCIILCMLSCQHAIKTPEAFYKWLNNPQNGFTKTKTINGFTLSAKYLPPEYLVYNEIKDDNNVSESFKDSLLKIYNHSMTFLLTIEDINNKDNNKDILHYRTYSKAEYERKHNLMNFNISRYITLIDGKIEYVPELHVLENNYGLGNKRSIYLVFRDPVSDKNAIKDENFKLVFDDPLFDTGITQFVFDKKKINNIPRFIFMKN